MGGVVLRLSRKINPKAPGILLPGRPDRQAASRAKLFAPVTLPHDFTDESLLAEALTHASTGETPNNERLEFLGDAVLDLLVAEELFRRDPAQAEGELTERKSAVVSRRALAEAAKNLRLGYVARFGPGVHDRQALPRSVHANLYEAVIGAVYLDAGLEAARSFMLATLRHILERAEAAVESERNPKQALQQLCQAIDGSPPSYRLVEERGQSHTRAFKVAAEHAGTTFPSAWGRTRKEAERWAAHEALLRIEPKAPTPKAQ